MMILTLNSRKNIIYEKEIVKWLKNFSIKYIYFFIKIQNGYSKKNVCKLDCKNLFFAY